MESRPAATIRRCISVSIVPGATALTRMPAGPHSIASERTRPSTPAFEAQYDARAREALGRGDRRDHDHAAALREVRAGGLGAEEHARRLIPTTRSQSATG